MIKIAFVHLTRSPNFLVPEDRKLLGIPPLWALSLASYLKEAAPNIKIKILDNQLLDFEDILGKIKQERFNVIGLSPQTNNYKENLEVARLAKQYGSQVVLGGIHATPLRKEILKNRGPYSSDYCVDAVIQQDGERAFYEYVAGRPFSKIKNLVYRERGGKIKENPIELLDLNELPLTNYGLVDLKRYFSLQSPPRNMVTYLSHRGCPWRERGLGCVFCALWDKGMRFKSPKKIWHEIKQLKSLYNIKYLFDAGDDFLGSKEWFEEICRIAPIFKDPPQLWIYCSSSSINSDIIKMLEKIHVTLVMVGIESLISQTLKNLKYGITVDMHKKAISLLAKSNIILRISLILGGAGENKKTLADTLKEIKSLPPKVIPWVTAMTLTPFPGSLVWQQLLEKEKKYRGQDLVDMVELSCDWVRNFCMVSMGEIDNTCRQIEKIKNDYLFAMKNHRR